MLNQCGLPNRRLRGSTLIEVLITMIIISIGLLGQAALIAKTSQSAVSSNMRTQATLLSYDLLARMRMNRTLAAVSNGPFNITFGSDSPTGSDIASFELRDWKTNVANSLPSGDAQVSVDAAGNVTIEIRWTDVANGKVDANGNVQTTTFYTMSHI